MFSFNKYLEFSTILTLKLIDTKFRTNFIGWNLNPHAVFFRFGFGFDFFRWSYPEPIFHEDRIRIISTRIRYMGVPAVGKAVTDPSLVNAHVVLAHKLRLRTSEGV